MSQQKRDNASIKILGRGPAICSGKKTASALIYTGKAAITSIILCTNGTNDATIVVEDGSTTVREFKVTGSENFGGNSINYPINVETDIDVTITGTGAYYFIDYIVLEE